MAITNETIRRMRLADLMAQEDGYGPSLMPQEQEGQMLGDLIGQIPGTFGRGKGAFQRAGGEVQQIESSPMRGPNPTYRNPIEIEGRKGYLQPDGSVIGQGWRRDSPADTRMAQQQQAQLQAQQKEEARQLDMQLKQADLAAKQGGKWKYDKDAGGFVNDLGEFKPMAAGQGGKQVTKPEQWKYDAGSDTWVAPPTEDNPQGKVTIPASRANAANSLKYVADQMQQSIEKTPQGGFMGVKGMVGRVTDSQDVRRFDNLREQLSTELRTLFRIPGEGALSDREQAQYGMQLPDVKNDPETNKQILQDIQARASMRVGQPQQSQQPANNQTQLMQEAQDAIARGAPREAVMQRLQERLRGQ